ncbi:MAG: GNAT family N-acetyltransferase [Oscillospiraceae bacterium]|nr:GNAT family N-acetyltransferase [Oscillospiraceae bacterium]
MIQLREITRENLDDILALDIREEQRRFVSLAAQSLAQAYVYRDTAFPFAVYDGDRAVGLIMLGYYEAKDCYTLWKFFIDKRYQHMGYGRKALELGIAFLKERFGASEVYTGVIPENDTAKRLYSSVGFEFTGLFENGMEEMRLTLS